MMGVGNLTELTDVDSAGVNTILIGFCEELGVRSVLTTAVINWARSSVREIDLARRLVHHAVARRTLPKHVEPRLVMLRDPEVAEFGAGEPGRAPAADPRPELADLRRGRPDPRPQQSAFAARYRPVPSVRPDGRGGAVARLLPGLRDDEGENRLDSEQDLSAGSSAGLGLPDGARKVSHIARRGAGPHGDLGPAGEAPARDPAPADPSAGEQA